MNIPTTQIFTQKYCSIITRNDKNHWYKSSFHYCTDNIVSGICNINQEIYYFHYYKKFAEIAGICFDWYDNLDDFLSHFYAISINNYELSKLLFHHPKKKNKIFNNKLNQILHNKNISRTNKIINTYIVYALPSDLKIEIFSYLDINSLPVGCSKCKNVNMEIDITLSHDSENCFYDIYDEDGYDEDSYDEDSYDEDFEITYDHNYNNNIIRKPTYHYENMFINNDKFNENDFSDNDNYVPYNYNIS